MRQCSSASALLVLIKVNVMHLGESDGVTRVASCSTAVFEMVESAAAENQWWSK